MYIYIHVYISIHVYIYICICIDIDIDINISTQATMPQGVYMRVHPPLTSLPMLNYCPSSRDASEPAVSRVYPRPLQRMRRAAMERTRPPHYFSYVPTRGPTGRTTGCPPDAPPDARHSMHHPSSLELMISMIETFLNVASCDRNCVVQDGSFYLSVLN